MKRLMTKLKFAALAAMCMGSASVARAATETYCVIDLTTSPKYTVTYTDEVPSGGWNPDVYKTTKLVLRYIPSGSVTVGMSTVAVDKPYYAGIFEVTEAQYDKVMAGTSTAKTPKVKVSWSVVMGTSGFVSNLNAKAGIEINLPTKDQWEYACRAGTTTSYYYGNNSSNDYMWCSANSGSATHEVGTATAELQNGGNPWGLYDMHGNVWECTCSEDPDDAGYYFFCGGSYNTASSRCTSSSSASEYCYMSNKAYGFRIVSNDATEPENFITLSSTGGFALVVGTRKWNGTLEYSYDKTQWSTLTGGEISAQLDGDAYVIYLRGNTSNTHITTYDYNYRNVSWFLRPSGTNKIACRGNIETLRGATGNNPSPTQMDDYCYYGLFAVCTSLSSAPSLPATSLSKGCYQNMFMNTSLTKAPALPATSLTDSCYANMFSGCGCLTDVSALPATLLKPSCYASMFASCTLLTDGPEIKATQMAERCCFSMFQNCDALTNAPTLAATKMAINCCEDMFAYCVSLTRAPAISATEMASNSCCQMFRDCTLLKSMSTLSATQLGPYCYREMFRGCTSLTDIGELPAESLAEGCYNSMFLGCTSLQGVPSALLPATVLATGCYGQMFSVCESLTNAPALPAETLADSCYFQMFQGCKALKNVPEFKATDLPYRCCFRMFSGCSSLVVNEFKPGVAWRIPSGGTTGSNWNSYMFAGTDGEFTSNPTTGKTYYVGATKSTVGDLRVYRYDGQPEVGVAAASGTSLTKDVADTLKSENITNLVVGSGITEIGANAFTDSAFWTLRDVTLGADVTSVGARAFKKCYGLTNVTSTATESAAIGDYAFSGCHSLQGLSFAGDPTFGTQSYTLQAAIYMKDGGIPEVYAMPTVTITGKSEHIMGKKTLTEAEWTDVTSFADDEKKAYHFFKIEMK